jgi:hypothetical protein
MPWQPSDAGKFNKGVQSKRQREVWAGIANETLAKTGDEGRAIRAANSAMKPRHAKQSS